MHFTDAKVILSAKNGMNIYRGCTHGCIYCDSRSKCYQMEHEFEDIEAKRNAPELLEVAIKRRRHRCMIGTGSMCDPYMHCESELGLTRRCLEVIDKYSFGATLQTKSDRILRDLELLKSINSKAKCVVQMTLTTFDEALCRVIEPNVCTTRQRFEALRVFRDSGIPTVVWLSPLLPFINDTEENLRGILDYCFKAGTQGILSFGIGLTLREGNREYFYSMLDRSFPGLKERYIAAYGDSYEISSPENDRLMRIFRAECRRHNVMYEPHEIFNYLSELPERDQESQLSLFQSV